MAVPLAVARNHRLPLAIDVTRIKNNARATKKFLTVLAIVSLKIDRPVPAKRVMIGRHGDA